MSEADSEFYVGYLPRAPAHLARRTRVGVIVVIGLALALAALIVLSQSGFGHGVFEYGTEREFAGVIEAAPYPVLAVDRPGDGHSRYLLSRVGKHGALPLVKDFVGQEVIVRGTLAYRDGMTMIEIADDGVKLGKPREASSSTEKDVRLGTATLIGEIVDSKCYLGVMKPGNAKTHRDCATRCISGGIPPVLLVRDADGNASYYLLVGAHGETLNEQVLDLIAEPIEVTGELRRCGDLMSLRADPATFRRLESGARSPAQ
ncbi:MAG: hypothetical protein ABI054_01930 [Planctomycetota bacterium]